MAVPSTTSARQAFDTFAPFYDRFTAHHDYEAWMTNLESLARRHGLEGRRLLDVATGTGKSFLPLLERGYEVTACDISPAMLAQAARKAGDRAELVLADMRHLPRLGPFDLVTCIDDPVNYLLDRADLAAAFRSASACLCPGGLYLFDVNTLHACRSLFSSDSCHESDGWLFIWRGRSTPDLPAGACAEATVEAFRPLTDGRWRRETNHHVQRHHPAPLLVACLEEAGLEPVAVYGQYQDGRLESEPNEERHTKLIYVVRKPHEPKGGERCSRSRSSTAGYSR